MLIKVVLPRPDSPATWIRGRKEGRSAKDSGHDTEIHLREQQQALLHTIIVKAAPLFATILCRWFGRLAMPIGEALSAETGGMVARLCGIVEDRVERGGVAVSRSKRNCLASRGGAIVEGSIRCKCGELGALIKRNKKGQSGRMECKRGFVCVSGVLFPSPDN